MQDFNKPVGTFTQSVFIPDSEQLALTVTSLGYGMVWGPLKKGWFISSLQLVFIVVYILTIYTVYAHRE